MSLRAVAPIALIILVALKFILDWEIDATFIAMAAFILFFGALVEMKVPEMVLSSLDTRSQEIARELAEAQRLKDQAAALLAEYEAKRKAAEAEAQEIVAQAKVQAEAVAADTKAQLADALARHERAAADKIARAEAQALSEVRAAAAEAAVQAAEKLLREQLNPAAQATLVERGVADLARAFRG